jgi:Zn-dependent peptidase ImmA (M78 family)/DNA-binding XRE family transcriptional regulator
MKSAKKDSEVLGERVAQARESVGYSIKDAASHLGFKHYQTLSSIEKGKRSVSAHELSQMSVLYGRPLGYFFEAEVSSDPKPLWRKVTDEGRKPIERLFLRFLENYSNLENILGLKSRWKDIQKTYKKVDFHQRRFKLANQLGVEIRKFLNLGSRPASNLLNALENDLRVKILHLSLPEGISGASVLDNDLGVGILINSNEVPWRRNFDLAHELFHIITWDVFTHDEVGDGTKRTRPEQYADAFASSLLLPESHLLGSFEELINEGLITFADVIELAKDFGVSTVAILWRLVNLGRMKKTVVEKALENPELTKIDRALRRGLSSVDRPKTFPEKYTFLACKSLMKGSISRGIFSEYIGIERTDIDQFLTLQGFVEKAYEEIAFT